MRAKKQKTQIPLIRDLIAILEKPLDETEKIAISPESYQDLISPFHETSDMCKEEHVAILFKKGENDFFSPLSILQLAVIQSPSASGTEEYFRLFWDRNIKDVITVILEKADSIRNSNYNTETRNMRPDFGLLVKDVCVLRGKEKGPQNPADPKRELVDKLVWVYDPAPYLLGE